MTLPPTSGDCEDCRWYSGTLTRECYRRGQLLAPPVWLERALVIGQCGPTGRYFEARIPGTADEQQEMEP